MELKVVLPICMCVWFVVGGGHAFIAGAYHELSQKPIKDQNWVEAKERLDKWSAIYTAISRSILPISIGFLIGTIFVTFTK
jgi:hypothetical protein